MRRGKDIKPIGRNEGGRLGANCSVKRHTVTRARINRLHQSRICNGHMNEAACRIEESCVRCSGKRPFTTHLSDQRIDGYERAAVASDVEQGILVIDVEPMRTTLRQRPMLDPVQLRQLRNQQHRRLADCKEDPCSLAIRNTPAWSPGQRKRPPLRFIEGERL